LEYRRNTIMITFQGYTNGAKYGDEIGGNKAGRMEQHTAPTTREKQRRRRRSFGKSKEW